jgi:hypothetical protein
MKKGTLFLVLSKGIFVQKFFDGWNGSELFIPAP